MPVLTCCHRYAKRPLPFSAHSCFFLLVLVSCVFGSCFYTSTSNPNILRLTQSHVRRKMSHRLLEQSSIFPEPPPALSDFQVSLFPSAAPPAPPARACGGLELGRRCQRSICSDLIWLIPLNLGTSASTRGGDRPLVVLLKHVRCWSDTFTCCLPAGPPANNHRSLTCQRYSNIVITLGVFRNAAFVIETQINMPITCSVCLLLLHIIIICLNHLLYQIFVPLNAHGV